MRVAPTKEQVVVVTEEILEAQAKKEIVCPGCGARYMKKRHLCQGCGAVLDRDAGTRQLVGRTSVRVIDHVQAEERERCAKLCDEESLHHIADSVELEEKGLLNLANDAFDRAITCGSLGGKIREMKP